MNGLEIMMGADMTNDRHVDALMLNSDCTSVVVRILEQPKNTAYGCKEDEIQPPKKCSQLR